MESEVQVSEKTICAHCGEDCIDEHLVFDNKDFCCTGCKTVYEILSDNDLCDYYDIDNPNITVRTTEFGNKYAFLDQEEIEDRLYNFKEGEYRVVRFFVPVIHCASCIWLLENLNKLIPGVSHSQVNFVKKEVTISFNRSESPLRKVVETMASIGYPPDINLEGAKEDQQKKGSRTLLIKMGVAGFCFGNIMLMSFPEYLSFRFQDEALYIQIFAYLNWVLALPVVFYCSTDYFKSAFKGLRHKHINLDVPISLGIAVLFIRSSYEILGHHGPGYMDSLAGLVFFLLIGKWFQNKTYRALSFERDYKSYFPLAVTLVGENSERSILVNQIKKGDRLRIHNNELIPSDGILLDDKTRIDYSFVTGESDPVEKFKGDMIYAGGRQVGGAIELIAQEKASQGYLTDLWNQQAFSNHSKSGYSSIVDRVSQYFTLIVIGIALLTLFYWLYADSSIALEAFTAVLIIACPCALALSLPFSMGNAVRSLGRIGFYAKNSESVERLAEIDTVVFDKTGTLTTAKDSAALFVGERRLTDEELVVIASMCSASSHPISKAIAKEYSSYSRSLNWDNYKELEGQGIEVVVDQVTWKLGSGKFVGVNEKPNGSHAFVQKNGSVLGHFSIKKQNRQGLKPTLEALDNQNLDLHLISGDVEEGQDEFKGLFSSKDKVRFAQSPQDKLHYLEQLNSTGAHTLMLGDGLNDAGALKASHVGVALSEDVYSFSPACDGIMDAEQFKRLPQVLEFSRSSIQVVRWSFALSFLYNTVGLYFAVQGLLTPIVAAILMPLSSISVVLFVTAAINLRAHRIFDTSKSS